MKRSRQTKRIGRGVWVVLFLLGVGLCGSILLVAARPRWATGIAFVDGLSVGLCLGATGLVKGYDDSWDEFFETTALTYLLGFFALFVYLFRRETPSAFFWVECAAGTISYIMLFFVPPLSWLGADLLLFVGTFVGWFFSGIFRPGYD
jgi:hypothetical protein